MFIEIFQKYKSSFIERICLLKNIKNEENYSQNFEKNKKKTNFVQILGLSLVTIPLLAGLIYLGTKKFWKKSQKIEEMPLEEEIEIENCSWTEIGYIFGGMCFVYTVSSLIILITI